MKTGRQILPDGLGDGFTPDELASIARESYRMSNNKAEAALQKMYLDQGMVVIRRGWPDFMVISSEGCVGAVEVKEGFDPVRPTQKLLMRVMDRLGFNVAVARRRGSDETWNFNCPCCGRNLDYSLDPYDPYDLEAEARARAAQGRV